MILLHVTTLASFLTFLFPYLQLQSSTRFSCCTNSPLRSSRVESLKTRRCHIHIHIHTRDPQTPRTLPGLPLPPEPSIFLHLFLPPMRSHPPPVNIGSSNYFFTVSLNIKICKYSHSRRYLRQLIKIKHILGKNNGQDKADSIAGFVGLYQVVATSKH